MQGFFSKKKRTLGEGEGLYEMFAENRHEEDIFRAQEPSFDGETIRDIIRSRVLESIDLSRETDDEEVRQIVDQNVLSYGRNTGMDMGEKHALSDEVFNSLRKLDVLQELIDDPTVSEVMINGPDTVYVERNGYLSRWERHFSSAERLQDVIQMIVSGNNRVVNQSRPIADTRLPDGSRVNVVLPPIAINGPIVTIRRFPKDPFSMEELIGKGTLSKEVALFLKQMVQSGENIFISGGTSSGKTTFLNALSKYIPPQERIITIEDSAELNLKGIKNLVRLETRNENTEGKNAITIRDLIKTSLRMRPDRIIVGEVRGAEALDMVSAMNSGHDGSLSTGHANSCRDMLKRLETMILMAADMPVEAIRSQIAAGIDIMVHLSRGRDGVRRLVEVNELLGCENGRFLLNPIYKIETEGDDAFKSWKKHGEIKNREKLCGI